MYGFARDDHDGRGGHHRRRHRHDHDHTDDRRDADHEGWDLHGPMGMGRRGPHRRFGAGLLGGIEDNVRVGRMLVQGDLRLIVLALTEEAPCHGYEIIKRVEEMTDGAYAPSPGVIYPTLTYLDEAGYVTAETEGNKKLYSITDAGRAHLAENRALADAILARLKTLGGLARRWHGERESRDRRDEEALPRSVEAALLNLREVVARRLADDQTRAPGIVEALLQAAQDLDLD